MSKRRSLWPREHGAYAQLLAPLFSALILRRPTGPAILIGLATCCAFLVNEPLLVALGHRGARMQATDGERARRRAVVLAVLAVVAGLAGVVQVGATTFAVAAVALVPAAALVVLAWRRSQHSIAGELVAACALPGAAAPVAVASGLPPATAMVMSGAWTIAFVASVVAVHRVIDRNRQARASRDWLLTAAMLAALAVVGVAGRCVPALWIAAPVTLASLVLVVGTPHPRHLRTIGVVLAIASTLSVAVACFVI